VTTRSAIVEQLERAGAEIEAAQQRIDASYRTLAHDFTAQNREAAAAAVAGKRRLIHQLRVRIAAKPASADAEEVRALAVRALKLWEEGLAATEKSLGARKPRQRRAASQAAGRVLAHAGTAIERSRAAFRLHGDGS
jgi:hypothetical protein